MELEMLKNIHSARGEMYAFLTRMFSNVPNDEMLQMLADMYPKLEQLDTDNQEMAEGREGIKAFLTERNSLTEKDLKAFDLDTSRHYTSLLCLTNSVPTNESHYTSPEHKERMDAYDQMVALHKRYGIEKTRAIPEDDDFVGYELQFMSKLAYAAAANIADAGNYNGFMSEQNLFHTNHLDKWIYDFFARVQNSTVEGERLYKHIARFASGFIKEDKAMLEEINL